MIQIRVMRFDDALGHQLVTLINRLLPAGSHFRLEPMPRLEYVDIQQSIAFPTGATHVREHVGEAILDINPDAPGGVGAAEVWRRRFGAELHRLAADREHQAMVELVSHDQDTIAGEFRHRRLDIGDISRMPDMMAASTLIHEFEEQMHRGSHPWEAPDFDGPHALAMAAESRVSGGQRLEGLELRHPENVDVTNAGSGQHWMWWIPFRTSDGGLWSNQLEMLGRNILRGRLGRYADEGAYRQAFASEVTNRRLDVARTVESVAG